MIRLRVIWLLLLPLSVYSQNETEQPSKIQIVDEISISGNHTLFRYNTVGQFGFGIGAYKSFFSEKRVALQVGAEFNRTSFFQENVHFSLFSHSENVTTHSNNLTIPVSGRVQFGKKTVFFIDGGCFFDFVLWSTQRSTHFSYVPDENNQMVFTKQENRGKAGIRSFNFGLGTGIGLRIPIKKVSLIFKSDYRYGFVPMLSGYEGRIPNQYVRVSLGIGWKSSRR